MEFPAFKTGPVYNRCKLPILLIGAREDVPPGPTNIYLSDETTEITTYPWEPHIDQLQALDGFCYFRVPAKGWYKTFASESESKQYWGGRVNTRLYQTANYKLPLQDYSLTLDDTNDEYFYDYATEQILKVMSRPFRWAGQLKEFWGYNYQNYLYGRESLMAINPTGDGISVTDEDEERGTKTCQITIEPAYPNYVFAS